MPGEFMAVDPKGRACMVAAVEKSKFVYVLNRDNEARLTISSPLEAHKVRPSAPPPPPPGEPPANLPTAASKADPRRPPLCG